MTESEDLSGAESRPPPTPTHSAKHPHPSRTLLQRCQSMSTSTSTSVQIENANLKRKSNEGDWMSFGKKTKTAECFPTNFHKSQMTHNSHPVANNANSSANNHLPLPLANTNERQHFQNHKRRFFDFPLNKCILFGLIFYLSFLTERLHANILPHFVLSEGQSEIVLRLKEGPGTPVGSRIYTLKGYDKDGDPLTFGLRGQIANELLRIENLGRDEAHVYLKKELDREVEDEYMLIVTLTDGKLSEPVSQSLLLLIEDTNDNSPIFKPYQTTIKVPENGPVPQVLAQLEAEDRDEGPYGQVVYKLQTEPGDEDLFSISRVNGQGVLKLMKSLDYEKKFLHQVRILALDRAETEAQINTATAAIVIEVKDVPDVGPEFVSAPPVTRLREDTPVAAFVLQVRAIDGDRGINNPISYSLLNENDVFGVDSQSGIVFTKTTLDRENARGGSYILQIAATEQNSKVTPRPSATTECTVIITDIDDEKPNFKSSAYLAEIVENSPTDVPVTFLGDSIPECHDHDLGLNGTFRLTTEGDGGVFEVTPSQGINQVSFLIRVKNPSRLDYERLKVINFSLVAESMSGDKRSKVPVTVLIRDVNDMTPEFEKDVYDVYLKENAPPGSPVVRIKATDKDSGIFGSDGIRYTALTGSIANELNLDPNTGVITTKTVEKSLLDRELSSVYYLTIEAQDNGGRGNRNTVPLILNLLDENDEKPVFFQSRYEARLLENDKEFVSPLRIQARDNDLKGTPNSEVHYSIVAGNEEGWLEVDDLSGRVKVLNPIDFEKLPPSKGKSNSNTKRLNMTLRANDAGTPPQFSFSFLTVFVTDSNDNRPVFAQSLYQTQIREDTPGGTNIVKVEATDDDASSPFNKVFYRIESGALDKFLIDPELGNVRLAPGAVLDYNEKSIHMLEIVGLDGGGKRSEAVCMVNITLIDVNNKVPRFIFNDIEGDKNVGIYHANVMENSPKGHYITQIRASDPDSQPVLRYGIDFNKSEARNENGRVLKEIDLSVLFDLDPVQGVLTVAGNLDRELMETVRLGLIVEDVAAENGRQIAHTTLIIRIEDENDNDPTFSRTAYFGSIPENSKDGTVVLTVRADDADLERSIKYSLLPKKDDKDRAAFPLTIDPETGVIEVFAKIDREMRDWINFTVVAEDSGTVPKKRHSKVQVSVRVIDENDNNPVFVDTVSNITVKEDAAVGTVIGQVEARDSDAGTFGKITYLLDRKSSLGKFVIDPDSGLIRVAEPLDREEQATYALVVQAWDNFRFGYATGESRNAFKQIQVILLDTNDMSPVFVEDETRDPSACHSVTEFHEDVIMTIRAMDEDDNDTPNGWVSFKIIAGNELNLFKLDQGKNTAKVVPARPLKGFYGNYTLRILLQDGGSSPNKVVKSFNICITDYNDNKPRFINPAQNFTIKVPENTTVGSSIIQVRAIDSDIGQNGVVRYKFREDLSGHSDTFYINSTTGVISLGKLLDRERQKIYHVRVEAYDLGIPTPLSSELDLTILVKNVDDHRPIFVQATFITNLTENISPGKEIVQLPPTIDRDDEDEEERKTIQVCYFILPDNRNSSELFIVDPLKHLLTTKVRLDREKQTNHTLTIMATENCLLEGKTGVVDKQSMLNVNVNVIDVNDNAPRFSRKIFTGGVSTSTDYGSEFMRVTATDADSPGPNSKLKYYIMHPITMSLSEGLSHLINNDNPLFNIDANSGAISLAFDPQPDMKGHFILNLGVNDSFGLSDKAKAFIYLLREDQKVKIVVRMSPVEVRQQVDVFTRTLSNVTGVIVNVDENFKYHENRDGSVDKTKTDFYVHLVHPEKNAVFEVDQVLKLIDLNIEELDDLFKDFNVLDTQASSYTTLAAKGHEDARNLFLVYASGTALFLALVLLVVISLCFAQRAKYQRQLKAATANAYGSNSTIIPRSGNVPNTNVHSVEGSNPIWMQAYHNNWYKEDSLRYENSDSRDSLDENAIATESASPPSSHMRSFVGSDAELTRRNDLNRTFHRNLMYHNHNNRLDTSGSCLILKKHLETTEL